MINMFVQSAEDEMDRHKEKARQELYDNRIDR